MKEPRDILAPLRDFQVIQFINKNNENTTLNLPPELIRLIGLYMVMPGKLERLLALVVLMKEQKNSEWNNRLADVSNTLNKAIAKNNPGLFVQIYSEAFATVTELIAGSETKLLLAASEGGNSLAVAQLLEIKGIDVNAKDNYGLTALIWAALNGRGAVVAQLLEKGSNVNAKNKYGYTALMSAASSGYNAIVEKLLQKNGIDVNVKADNGATALMLAAYNGHEGVVTQLLNVSAIEVNAKDNEGKTALTWAARNGHKAVVHALCLKQLFDAPSDAADGTLERLKDEINKAKSSVIITPISLCDHLLASLEKIPTQDEKTALLNKALSNDNAFSVLMQQAGLKQRIQTELDKLNTPSMPVLFSTAPPTETRAARNSASIIG